VSHDLSPEGAMMSTLEAAAGESSRMIPLAFEELEQFQRLTVGRELKMIELKKEIEYLKKNGPTNGRKPDHE
jgi:hypothetical protein